MAETYNVSRTFVYALVYIAFTALYTPLSSIQYPSCPVTLRKKKADKEILIQRLEGNSSIEREHSQKVGYSELRRNFM